MRSEEEDLVKKLSARLSEEIENLPKEGKNHQLTIKIQGNRGHINLGHQTFDIKTTKEPPPEGSDRARECPQCHRCTWRYTHLCMHCDYNLHSHDEAAAYERKQADRERQNLQVLKIFLASVAIAAMSFFIGDYLPETLKTWALGFTGVFGLFAFMIMAAHR
jgi:hypothetical protein